MITIPIEIGDEIRTGKFKNKRTIVKSIGEDENGQPTINGKTILKFKFQKKEDIKKENKLSKQDKIKIIESYIYKQVRQILKEYEKNNNIKAI